MNTVICQTENRVVGTKPTQENPRYSGLKTSTIMLVDDEPMMMEIVQALLEEEGYQHFISVQDSTQAIDKLAETNPDILLLDLDMPQVDGFEVLKRLRMLEEYLYLPVIILTASEDPDSKLRALELGATDFLSKPVDPSELALRVRNTLSAKAYQDYLTYYDNLTGLPNRRLFLDLLTRGIYQSKRDNVSLALLDIGLDRFRSINESLGVYQGDLVLKRVAIRITEAIRGSDIVWHGASTAKIENMARTGGDEFSVVLYGVNSVENASIVSNRVLQAIKRPFTVDGDNLFLTASIGIAAYPDDGEEAETLIQHAGSAKDFAKKKGMDCYLFFSSEMEAHSRVLIKMESDLRAALERQQFELYYQPKIEVSSGKIMGMESLVRWFHPEDGLVSPVKFIPVAEELGLIVPLGEWVLQEACRRTSEWIAAGYSELKVSVNVSAKQFTDPGFKTSIISALQSSGLNPRHLILEITESMLMGDIDQLAVLLHDIKTLGISFSLDDFGTGYSSLSYLKKFPIDELKIDRSFMLDVPANNDDSSIVRAIIAMAHSLGQKVVAEGVEEAQQLDFLRQYNCDVIQGYYFSHPLNKADFTSYLSSKTIVTPAIAISNAAVD